MNYKFEWNDIRAFLTTINFILIIRFGLSFAWFGVAVSTLGLIKDFTVDKKINGVVMHGLNLILNLIIIF